MMSTASTFRAVDPENGPLPRGVVVAVGLWAALATALSAAGVMRALPPWAVPGTIWSGFFVFLALYLTRPVLRTGLLEASPRPAILFHVCRAVIGAAFLWLYAEGRLPREFAVPAGWGDIAAGLGALVAARYATSTGTVARRIVLVWNVLALIDILFVFVTAQRLIFFGPGPQALAALTGFPGGIIPLFVVPMVLISHFLVFARLRYTAHLRIQTKGVSAVVP